MKHFCNSCICVVVYQATAFESFPTTTSLMTAANETQLLPPIQKIRSDLTTHCVHFCFVESL